ncbi:MAG TPA: cysteine desulfurase, partial [Candidatus Micrarchaeota archaeon]|nr:cysteine desulfurase [Candidatus Micrarchaeota archaeon]
ATDKYERAREIMARFIGAKPSEVIFTSGATESLNMLAYALSKKHLKKNGKITITEMEHHANIVPWQLAGESIGSKIEAIPFDTETLALDMSNARAAIKGAGIFSFTHVSNAIGRINNARELAGMAHDFGVPVCIDAAQSVAHMKLDVKKLGCDFLAFSGHKMLGPTGIGVLYVSEEWGERLPPAFGGGDMIREVAIKSSKFMPPPAKFEAGTMPIAQAIGLGFAAEYLERHRGALDAASGHADRLAKGLEGAGAKVYRRNGGKGFAPIVAFTLAGMHPHDIATILDRKNVMVRSGHHCAMPLHRKMGLPATCRASYHIYNSEDDTNALLAGIEDAKKILG